MPTNHRIVRQITLAIALGAVAVPTASAQPNSEPGATAQSRTAAVSVAVHPNPDQQTYMPSLVVRPNPDQQVGQSGGGAPSHVTRNTPRGVAIDTDPPKPTVNDLRADTRTFAQTHSVLEHGLGRPNGPGADGASLSTLKTIGNAGAAEAAASAPAAITAPSDDFDYGAAAIGAGITAAIAVLIAAGTLGLRRPDRPRHP